jgi:hypothetical protein
MNSKTPSDISAKFVTAITVPPEITKLRKIGPSSTNPDEHRLAMGLETLLAPGGAQRLRQLQYLSFHLFDLIANSSNLPHSYVGGWCWDERNGVKAGIPEEGGRISEESRNRVLLALTLHLTRNINADVLSWASEVKTDPSKLDSLKKGQLEVPKFALQKFAEESRHWPALVGAYNNRLFQQDTEILQLALRIGSRTLTKSTRPEKKQRGRPVDFASKRQKLFEPLIEPVVHNRHADQPAFTTRSIDNYCDAVWALIQHMYHGPKPREDAKYCGPADGSRPDLDPQLLAHMQGVRKIVEMRSAIRRAQTGGKIEEREVLRRELWEENQLFNFLLGCSSFESWPTSGRGFGNYDEPLESRAWRLRELPDRWYEKDKQVSKLSFVAWWKEAKIVAAEWLGLSWDILLFIPPAEDLMELPNLSVIGRSWRKSLARSAGQEAITDEYQKEVATKIKTQLRLALKSLAPETPA